MHPWHKSGHYPSPLQQPMSQLGCMHITIGVGFDLAVSPPTHNNLLALRSHNVTTVQTMLFTAFEGPHRSVGVHHPNSRGHTKAWKFITQLEGPHNFVDS